VTPPSGSGSISQPASVQLGIVGESAVKLFFDRLGWGPLSTGKHDLGTDLFVQLRDREGVDLGIMIGVQVKTGDTWFREHTAIGERHGWWFREGDQKHRNYWADHHIPHILVIQDAKQEKQFWARLDNKTIETTDAGIRVFVPDDQQLSDECAGLWINMAAEARKLQSFEGSRWTFNITQLPQSEWPRYALLASRITAPHPNQGFEVPINWAEATALCIEADSRRWEHFAKQYDDVPSPADAQDSDNPGWRFAAAVASWTEGDSHLLESLDTTTLPPSLQVAHAVCLSLALQDRGRRHDAINLLRSHRTDREYSADQAWLAVQVGWALFDDGNIEGARSAFRESIQMHAGFPSSLVNSAIRSAGIMALFDTAPGLSGDVATTVQAYDSTLSWWRTEKVENALNRFLRRSYSRWAHDPSRTIGAADITHNDLVSAELTARIVGNRRSARYAAYLRSMANLALPQRDDTSIEDQLETLRTAGYAKELSLALKHLRNEGPLAAINAYIANIKPSGSTPTSIMADLSSIQIAGDFLPTAAAQHWVEYMSRSFTSHDGFLQKFNLDSDHRHKLLEALSGLRLHFTKQQELRIIDLTVDLPPDSPELLKNPLNAALKSLSLAVVNESEERINARIHALPEDCWIYMLLVAFRAPNSEEARSALSARIRNDTLSALSSGVSLDTLTEDEANAVIDACSRAIDRYNAEINGYSMGGVDVYRVAVQMALVGPGATRANAWNLVVTSLTSISPLQDRKTDALKLLAANAHRIPDRDREVLRQCACHGQSVAQSKKAVSAFFSTTPAGPAFAELFLELEPENEHWEQALARLLAGNQQERESGIAVLARRSGHELLLLAATRDPDTGVRLAAIRGLARRAAEDASVAAFAVPQLLAIIKSSGERAAAHVGQGINAATTHIPEVESLIEALRAHASPFLRKLAEVDL